MINPVEIMVLSLGASGYQARYRRLAVHP
jgi:hypothetical protein